MDCLAMPYDGQPINLHHVSIEKLRDWLKESQLENIKMHQEYGNLSLDLRYAMDLLEDIYRLDYPSKSGLPADIYDRLEALFTQPF
jgi:hypothetical protein